MGGRAGPPTWALPSPTMPSRGYQGHSVPTQNLWTSPEVTFSTNLTVVSPTPAWVMSSKQGGMMPGKGSGFSLTPGRDGRRDRNLEPGLRMAEKPETRNSPQSMCGLILTNSETVRSKTLSGGKKEKQINTFVTCMEISRTIHTQKCW